MQELHDEYGGGLISEQDLRRISRWGWILLAIWAIVLIAYAVVVPNPYAKGWLFVLELAFLGHVVSIYEAIQLDCSKTYMLIQNLLQDIILLLLLYPWIVRIYEKAVGGKRATRFVYRITESARHHQKWIRPFGALGLWGFVFFPFWSTGVLVGGVIGYFLGMPTWLVFSSVFLGHGLSVLSLVFFFDWLAPKMERFDEGFARYFAWILIAAVFATGWTYQRIKRWIAKRKGTPTETAEPGSE